MALPNRIRFRADDIWDTPEDGNRYEVIDGELYVSPPPSFAHQSVVSELFAYLHAWVKAHALGRVLVAPLGVVLNVGNGVQPDIVYISRERADTIRDRGIDGAPDLLVEVLSPSTANRDRGIKMTQFAVAGVPHYWIVDPRTHRLEAYELRVSGYELANDVSNSDLFRPSLFPGLVIPLAELWG